jgi:hypothetical protein
VDTVKEKSSTLSVASISDSIVENVAFVKTKSFEVAGKITHFFLFSLRPCYSFPFFPLHFFCLLLIEILV